MREDAYLTDAFGREAVSFIQRHESEPFFLYLSFNAPHTPMHVTDELLDRFSTTADPVRRRYNGMTFAIDEAVGAVMAQLRRSNLVDDTLVFFLSDNGGPTVPTYAYNASSNAPLRGSKGTALEGGIRVPFVMSWPGVIPAGSTFDEPVVQLDVAPTVLARPGSPLCRVSTASTFCRSSRARVRRRRMMRSSGDPSGRSPFVKATGSSSHTRCQWAPTRCHTAIRRTGAADRAAALQSARRYRRNG